MKLTPTSVFQLFIYVFSSFCLTNKTAIAQVTPDDTVNTQVTPNGNVSEITGGETRGGNLFHSFQDFSVPTGNEAAFLNPDTISNIFSRVTGGNISNIDGLISTSGSANLFLINPAGIIFGENASLDVGGSFYASSASSILFEEGEFSATDLATTPVLTINAPIGLGFRDQPGDIVNRSNFGLTSRVLDETFSDEFAEENFTVLNSIGLEVSSGKTFALVGGNIILENIAGITAPEGKVELGGLSQAGTITLNNDGSLTYPENVSRSNVSLTENSKVEVRGNNGGLININAKNLLLSGQSKIFAGIAEGEGSANSQAGNITINATDSVKLIGQSRPLVGLATEINNHVGTVPNRRDNLDNPSNATGNGGAIIINTNLLEISEQARITADSFSQGSSGDIILNTNNITMNGGAIASLVWEGTGDAGNLTINNQSGIVLNEGSNIQSQVINGGIGDVGDITINTDTLAINEKYSFILADNQSAGNAGNITINATDSIFIDGGGGEDLGKTLSGILSQVQMDVIGNAGDITISTPQLSLTNFALISSNVKTGSVGNTGNISLDVGTLNLSNGAVIDSLTENDFNGGNISINANQINLTDGGKIVTSGNSSGDAGSIELNITDTITINNDNPPSDSPFEEQILKDTALETGIFASSVEGSTGSGGSIDIKSGSIEFVNNGSIEAVTHAEEGGNITLQTTKDITFNKNSSVSAQAFNNANGGNLEIDARFIIAYPNGNNDILASAELGQGGNININAESLFGIAERPLNNLTNDINASSEVRGLDGTINVNTLNLNPVQGATELPNNVVEPEQTTQQTCQANRETTAKNTLTVRGKGGTPAEPVDPLNAQNVYVNGETNPISAIPEPIETSQGKIQPARGVKITESGEIILTAYRTNNQGERLFEGRINCGI
jgi:filamentous hemagglutinin family protein